MNTQPIPKLCTIEGCTRPRKSGGVGKYCKECALDLSRKRAKEFSRKRYAEVAGKMTPAQAREQQKLDREAGVTLG